MWVCVSGSVVNKSLVYIECVSAGGAVSTGCPQVQTRSGLRHIQSGLHGPQPAGNTAGSPVHRGVEGRGLDSHGLRSLWQCLCCEGLYSGMCRTGPAPTVPYRPRPLLCRTGPAHRRRLKTTYFFHVFTDSSSQKPKIYKIKFRHLNSISSSSKFIMKVPSE